jgi:hypothetical protein
MPISRFLDGRYFDPETRRLIGVAFEMARAAVRLTHSDAFDAIIAERIIELAKAGELDPNVLCEAALKAPVPGVQRPQSSSASRVTEGSSETFILNQPGDRPGGP